MVYYRNWIVPAAVVFTLIAFIPSAQVEPPAKPGNSGSPSCLAKVDKLEQIIADQQATMDAMEQTIAEQETTIVELQEQIDILQASLDAMKNYAPVPRTVGPVLMEACKRK